MSSRLLAGTFGLIALAGCNTTIPQTTSLDPGLGEAVKYNAAIQVIDPDPVYSAEGAQPGDSGAKGAAAVKRYRTDTVKDVQTQSTTTGSGSGSGPQ